MAAASRRSTTSRAKLIAEHRQCRLPRTRAMLFGQFNYGKRGILDMTHTRLFTFRSFRRLLEEAGSASSR